MPRKPLRPTLTLALGAPLVLLPLLHAAAQSPAPGKVDYNRDIRPILAANCFSCHGQDPAARQANLRLDLRDGAIAARGGKRAVEPGKPEQSTLIDRVNATNALVMPPAASGHRLTPEQKRTLALWIKQGALYAQHWAFTPVMRPAVPKIANPKGAIRNPIDAFVQARLAQEKLTPSTPADPATLLRRVSLDLTGLPPTPAEAQQFLREVEVEKKKPADGPDAYSRAVDRLLASPRYGEHWARMWLDLARYADTQGYEKDLPRTIWRYRDWVIDAFNADMPYDEFTIQQLAGDLWAQQQEAAKSGATAKLRQAVLATAFHRNTMTNTEGGTDPEEFRIAAVKDRVDTTVQVWMGLTMGCAKCHSHKYDPLSIRDYYSFYALFNQTEDANRGNETPTSPTPTEQQLQRQAVLDEKLAGLRQTFNKPIPNQTELQGTWEAELATQRLWTPIRFESAVATSGATLKARDDAAILVSGKREDKDTYVLTLPLPNAKITALRLEVLKDPSLPNGGPGREASDQNVVTSELKVEHLPAGGRQRNPVELSRPRADFEQGGWPIAAAIDGDPGKGWAFSPQNAQPHVAVFDFDPAISNGGKIVVTLRQEFPKLQHGCFRLSVSTAQPLLLKAELQPFSDVAVIPREQRTPDQHRRLDEAFRQTHEPSATIYRELTAVEKERDAIQKEIPATPVLRELAPDKLRVTRIHQRGNFLDPGETVTAAVPTVFGPLPQGAPLNRLGAAQWLVSKDNPLTARVAVNRLWARLFGTGFVETEEDFGTQGTMPTHPELLDWLASWYSSPVSPSLNPSVSLSSGGWSTKKLLKLIVTSATYRQSGAITPERLKADPTNRLLARGPRFRLPAETIRDQALATSGLLSAKMHGPSVMPPQPDGLWKSVYNGGKWETSPGEDRYRRSLYTFWKRSTPYPSLTTFDAGSGEFCVVRRVRTNTPLQALVTLNDPAFVEAAGALGKAMLSQPKDRLAYGFRRVLVRAPSTAEQSRLQQLYDTSLAELKAKPEKAMLLLASANTTPAEGTDLKQLAAYTVVANVLLNLDETLTKP